MTDIISQLKEKIEYNRYAMEILDKEVLKLEKNIAALKISRCYYSGLFDEANEAYNIKMERMRNNDQTHN